MNNAMGPEVVREILSKKEDFVRRHLVLSDDVVGKLIQAGVIGEYAKRQMVTDRGNTTKQVNLLLTALRTRGLDAFRGFLDVLRETYQGWIAEDILSTTIELENKTGSGEKTSFNVSDIVNHSYQTNITAPLMPYGPAFYGNNGPSIVPYVLLPPYGAYEYGFDHGRENRRRTRNDPDVFNSFNVISPITKLPENIRHLQNMFEKETSVTQKSLSVLRNEEATIKSLLQQNLSEQKHAIRRQEALTDIRRRITQINSRTAQLYRPRVNAENARTRLKHLQKMARGDDDG